MPETRAVTDLQTDLKATNPRFQDKVTLRDALATNKTELDWVEPSADRVVTIGDPGGNDSIAFLDAPQVFQNKQISTPPSAPNDIPNKDYVDALAASGIVWREALLTSNQLDSVNDGVAQAIAFYLDGQPQDGDTFTIENDTDGVETYTFRNVASLSTEIQIGGTPDDTMTNMAAQLTGNSVFWDAAKSTVLGTINDGSGASTTGHAVMIWKRVPDDGDNDRIYGSLTTQSFGQFVNYSLGPDYTSIVSAELVVADPAVVNFGLGRATANLKPGEAHLVLNEDEQWIWEADAGVWQQSGATVPTATAGSGGGVQGRWSADSDKGLDIVAGVGEVKIDNSTITFNGSGEIQAAGTIPDATSAPGGGTVGKSTFDENFGLEIVPGAIARAKVDGVTVTFNGSGELQSSGATTGLLARDIPFTRDITAVTPPTLGTTGTDIDTLDHPDGVTTGQRMEVVVPDDYESGPLDLVAVYQMSTAVGSPNNQIRLTTQAKIVDTVGGLIDSATYPETGQDFTVPDNATDVVRSVALLSIAQGDFGPGDTIQFYVKRIGASGTDLHTGDWKVISYQFTYTGQVATRAVTQNADFWSDTDEAGTTPGTIGTDIDTEDFPTGSDAEQKFTFIVPDNWDGISDGHIRLSYAMSTAAAGTVQLELAGEIANVVDGSVDTIAPVFFDLIPPVDTDPHRSVVLLAIPASALHAGDYLTIKVARRVGVGGNHSGDFQGISATLTLGVAPSGSLSAAIVSEEYLPAGVFNPISGAGVNGDTDYPSFAGDFESLDRLSSTVAAGRIDVGYQGRLSGAQSQITSIDVRVKGTGASPEYRLKVYAEGSGGTAVFEDLVNQAAPVGITTRTLTDIDLSAQPTGFKRFHVVVEAYIDASEEVLVSRPFVKQE